MCKRKGFIVLWGFVIAALIQENRAFARGYSSILIGPTFSQHSIENSSISGPSSAGVGVSFGSFYGVEFSERFGFELGVFFVKRTTAFENHIRYSITTVSIPLLVTYAPLVHMPHLKLELGPYFGLMPWGSYTQNGNTLGSNAGIDQIDIGAVGGVTYLIPVSYQSDLRMSTLYSFGFTDMRSGPSVIQSRGLDVLIGFSFYI